MTLSAFTTRQIPVYHKWMYLDGYTPEQIMYAFQKAKQQQYIEIDNDLISQAINEAVNDLIKAINK